MVQDTCTHSLSQEKLRTTRSANSTSPSHFSCVFYLVRDAQESYSCFQHCASRWMLQGVCDTKRKEQSTFCKCRTGCEDLDAIRSRSPILPKRGEPYFLFQNPQEATRPCVCVSVCSAFLKNYWKLFSSPFCCIPAIISPVLCEGISTWERTLCNNQTKNTKSIIQESTSVPLSINFREDLKIFTSQVDFISDFELNIYVCSCVHNHNFAHQIAQ